MGTIFILAGSLIGFLSAVILVGFGGLSLWAGLALWVASGPISAGIFVALVLPFNRLLNTDSSMSHLA